MAGNIGRENANGEDRIPILGKPIPGFSEVYLVHLTSSVAFLF